MDISEKKKHVTFHSFVILSIAKQCKFIGRTSCCAQLRELLLVFFSFTFVPSKYTWAERPTHPQHTHTKDPSIFRKTIQKHLFLHGKSWEDEGTNPPSYNGR